MSIHHGPAPAPADVPDLGFAVKGARAMADTAVPTVAFRLALSRSGGGPVRSVSLNAAVRIAVARRRYDRADRLVMARLFGQPEQWATSMQPLTWARISTVVPPFETETEFDLPVPCSRDAELAVTSYFHGVRDGEVPLDFLFNGTVFFDGPDKRLRTSQISWDKDATYQLPAGLWHEVLGRYGSGTSWVPLSPEAHDALMAHRDRNALPGWNETVSDLLSRAQRVAGAPGEGAHRHVSGVAEAAQVPEAGQAEEVAEGAPWAP